jgi:hypothetical protein
MLAVPFRNMYEAFVFETLIGCKQLKGFIKVQGDKVSLKIEGLI